MPVSSILFICLGNICRSPLAEGVFRDEATKSGLANSLNIDSAGIGGWHVGNPPDPRAIEKANQYGIDISHQTSRKLTPSDFSAFDLILCMDEDNIADCHSANRQNGPAKIELFTAYAGLGNLEIPDPYYGGVDGFEIAYQMIKQASIGTIEQIATS